jgi:hypothetical protein
MNRVLLLLAVTLAPTMARQVQFGHGTEESAITTPLVSLMMPVDGTRAAHFFAAGLAAAAKQSYDNLEVVIVDSGDDNRADLISAADRAWTTYIHFPQQAEDSARVSWTAKALASTRGSIVMLWDPRDMHAPSRVESQVRPLIDGTSGMHAQIVRVPRTRAFCARVFPLAPLLLSLTPLYSRGSLFLCRCNYS